MNRAKAAVAILGVVVAATAAADANDPTARSERVRDNALARLEGWRPISAESILKKATDVEGTHAYKTAQGFLLAVAGVGRDEEMLNRGLEILEAAAKADPADPVVEYYRGIALAWVDRENDAKKAWQNAEARARAIISDSPKDATAQYYLGAALVRQNKQANNARKALKKASQHGFDQVMVDFQTGLSYLLQQKWGPARKAFDEVHEFDPRFSHLYYYRGIAWDKLGEKDKLINDFDQFVKLAPNAPEASRARAVLKAIG
jgi:tetratricopeptide (TPR) repeat protein